MSKGQEQVQVALKVCQDASEGVRKMTAVEEAWKTEVERRLACVQEGLDGVMDKFFLKTKLCLPFTAKCEQNASGLKETFRGLDPRPDGDAQQRFISALDALEKAVKALVDRSAMQGMTIT